MTSRPLITLVAVAAAAAFAARAEMPAGQVCLTPDGQVEPTATQGWQQALQNSDPRAMQFLAGRWYNQTRNPGTGQISHLVFAYEADGGMTYANDVCGPDNANCSHYEGYGMYAAQWQGQDSISIFTNISDMSRSSFCSLSALRFLDQDRAAGPDGQVAWQRMK